MQKAAVTLAYLAEEDRLAKHGAENAPGPFEGARDTAVPLIKVVKGDEPQVGDCRLEDGIEPRLASAGDDLHIAGRIASVVVALPSRTWPMVHSSTPG